MSRPRRIDPRRPFIVTGAGRKRYALGRGTVPGAGAAAPANAGAAPAAKKPVRLQTSPARCILAVAHTDRGLLTPGAQQAIAAAALLADDQCAVLLLAFGPLAEDPAPYGADLVIALDDAAGFHPDRQLHILAELMAQRRPAHIVMADTDLSDGDLGRRLAAAHGLSIATHVAELTTSTVTVYRRQRSMYARRPLPDVILLDADCVDTRLPFTGRGDVVDWSAPRPAPSRYADHGVTAVPASHLPLEEADFIVSAGNGVHDIDAFHKLADAFGAAVGASRVAVDDGRFTREQQVGATGKTVSSSVYMALGISGAVQHLQGIKDCRHVIAVNTDSSAPMIKRADLSVIDDAQSMIRALLAEVGAARRGRKENAQ